MSVKKKNTMNTRLDKITGKNLRRLREERRLTQEKLAELAGNTTQPNLSRIEKRGQGLNPDLGRRLAKAMNISLSELYAEPDQVDKSGQTWYNDSAGAHVGESEAPYILRPRRSIPLLTLEACGDWTDFTDLEFPMRHSEKTQPSLSLDKNAFFVVAGGSMEPRIERGDHVLIEPSRQAKSGDIVFAVHEGEAMIRRMYLSDDTITLVSTKQRTPPITVARAGFECFRAVAVLKEI